MISTFLAAVALSQTPLPTPLVRWVLDESRIVEGSLVAVHGPNPEVSGFPKPVTSPWGPAMELNYELQTVVLPWFVRSAWSQDPKEDFTASVAFRVEERKPDQRLAGCIFSNQGRMVGWQITLQNGVPILEVGHPSGTVKIDSKQDVVGKWTWVSAGYTGREAWLALDGREVGRAAAPFGPLPYSGRAPLAVSGYWHGAGSSKFRGQVREFRVDHPALTVAQATLLHRTPVAVPPMPPSAPEPAELKWEIPPFLLNPQAGTVTVAFETTRRASAVVWHGPRPDQLTRRVAVSEGTIHHAKLEGLPAGEPWFYRVETRDSAGNQLGQDVKAFRTLPGPGQTVRFVVTADTQSSPDRTVRVAAAMWEHRPDFVVVAGDLVGEGWLKQNWRDHFFSSMRPLLTHAPLVPVLGNHERNARLYYLYMNGPHFYRLPTGPVELFVTDTEQPTDPSSEQYQWLNTVLGQSGAAWKIGVHHYPAYSSGYDTLGDPTDFGGDSQARNLVPLYERHGVVAALSGHVHHYERTFALRGGKPSRDGVTYFTLGGGGGGLDQNLPAWRFDFSRNRRSSHHFALFTATETELHVQIYDWDNRLFDEWKLSR